jgi:hypothetical protein
MFKAGSLVLPVLMVTLCDPSLVAIVPNCEYYGSDPFWFPCWFGIMLRYFP